MLSEKPLISPEQDEPEGDLDVEVDAEGEQEEIAEEPSEEEPIETAEEEPVEIPGAGKKAQARIQQTIRQRNEAQAKAAAAEARTAKLEATLERFVSAQENSLNTVQARHVEAAQEQALRQTMHEIEQRFGITDRNPEWHVMLNQERRILAMEQERHQKFAEFEQKIAPIQAMIAKAQEAEVAAKYEAALVKSAETLLAPFAIGPKLQAKILKEAFQKAAEQQLGDPAQAIKLVLREYDSIPRRKTAPVPPGNKIPQNVTRAGSSASAVGGRTKGQTGSGQARRASNPEDDLIQSLGGTSSSW